LILQDQGRSARIVTAEGAGLFLRSLFVRSSLIAAPLAARDAIAGYRLRLHQNGLPALTFHNSRSDQDIDSRFA
jgi:hypothetical protein